MARFYWVFDGFVEPEHCQEYRGPEHGLRPLPLRQELRAQLEPQMPSTADDRGRAPADPRLRPASR